MITQILIFFSGIILGFGIGFYSVYNYYKEKILIQEISFTKENIKMLEENNRLLEDNLLLVKDLNNKQKTAEQGNDQL